MKYTASAAFKDKRGEREFSKYKSEEWLRDHNLQRVFEIFGLTTGQSYLHLWLETGVENKQCVREPKLTRENAFKCTGSNRLVELQLRRLSYTRKKTRIRCSFGSSKHEWLCDGWKPLILPFY